MDEAFQVLELDHEGTQITATVLVPPDCRFFQGHFPEESILPGVAQVVLVVHLLEATLGRPFSVRTIRRIKFSAPVRPGTTLNARLDLRDPEVRFRLSGPEGEISSGEIAIHRGER